MELNHFQELLNCIKLLEQKTIQFPDIGKQRKYRLYCISDKNEKFEFIKEILDIYFLNDCQKQ